MLLVAEKLLQDVSMVRIVRRHGQGFRAITRPRRLFRVR
jgi:hypothetical protein